MKSGSAVAGLPYSRGKQFASLDEYLAYLKQYNGPVDLPWWREISPDVYEQVIHMPSGEGKAERATRAELMARFGFKV